MTFMGTLWTLAAVIAALAAACIGDLISEEIRCRLDRLPQRLIRLAVRRVPADLRRELYDEWTAELEEVLRGAQAPPITRLVLGTLFAGGLLRVAGDIGRQLTASEKGDTATPHSSRHVLNPLPALVLVLGVLVVAASLVWLGAPERTNGGPPTAGGAIVAPPGYTSTRDPGSGISLAVPNGWTRSQFNNNTFWTAPDRNSFIQIDTTVWADSSNQQALRAEADVKRRSDAFGDYSQKGIEDLTYQGQPATDWEFTFTAANKQKIHAQERFVRLGGHTYAVYFRVPDSAWLSSADRVNVLYQTFRASG
jgi:hypothetical protein